MYVITGATGQLGRIIIDKLLETEAPGRIIAAVRNPAKAADLARRGVQVREADYNRPETLEAAFVAADRLLLISSSDVDGRLPQHRAVIEAARRAGVALIAYTSMLCADTSPAKLAREHRETEQLLFASNVPSVVLRNGWYTENHLLALRPALQAGAFIGAARDGRFSSATRADYAEAAAAALRDGTPGRIYELAGDTAFSLAELAAEVSRQSGREVGYQDLGEEGYERALVQAGLPPQMAEYLADADARAASGALFDDGQALSRMIGRPTTLMRDTVASALSS